uniref:Transcriptional regulator n=1 Tax=Ascaris lumbricoides TaxID=6252 RepID=A0A0M3IP97_ASCLU
MKNHDTSDQLVKEMCKLLARMTSKQTCSSKVWRCYAALHQPNDRDCSVEQHEKYLNLLERAYLADYNRQKWYTEEQQCSKVLKMAVDVFEEKLHLAKLKNIDPKPVMSEVRMNARPLVAMVERVYGIDASNAVSTELREIFTSVKQLIEDVICH